jgi:hypothetical protein
VALHQEFNDKRIAQFAWNIGQLANDIVKCHAHFRSLDFIAIDHGHSLVLARQGLGVDRRLGGLLVLAKSRRQADKQADAKQEADHDILVQDR